MFNSFFAWVKKHERHLSALAMVAGFVADNIFFTRVDLTQTQVLLGIYTLACFISIPTLHWIESRKSAKAVPRFRLIFPLITQFALGGFWSAFVIFYGRSAVLGASWPFLLFLFLIFLGSEYFHQYHERLVFTSVLFFFALYSTAIFIVPIYTHTLGTGTFLLSGAVAIGAFALFTILLRLVAHERFYQDVWRIRVGAGLVLVAMHFFYFTDILPPLPLSATAAGVYREVWHASGTYLALEELQSWWVRYLGFTPTMHDTYHGQSLYVYSSVFAPTALTTVITHRWQWYDPKGKKWITTAVVSYPIVGGRDGGYKGYSQAATDTGDWRVNIETAEGRLIAQIPFTVVVEPGAGLVNTVTLK